MESPKHYKNFHISRYISEYELELGISDVSKEGQKSMSKQIAEQIDDFLPYEVEFVNHLNGITISTEVHVFTKRGLEDYRQLIIAETLMGSRNGV